MHKNALPIKVIFDKEDKSIVIKFENIIFLYNYILALLIMGNCSSKENINSDGAIDELDIINDNDKFEIINKAEEFKIRKNDGTTTFNNLSNILKQGEKFVTISSENQLVGSVVCDANFYTYDDTRYFRVTGMFISSNGKSFYKRTKTFNIQDFSGNRRIIDLEIRPMNENDYDYLNERGRKYVKYGLKCGYVSYTGTMFIKRGFANMHYNSVGRIMIDHYGFRKDKSENGSETYIKTVPDTLLYLTWPFFEAYSFKAI